jgi:hypothetical protein
MSSRRSSRDPNASSFNLFTGEEISGAPQTTQRATSQKTASSFNLFTGEEISGANFEYQQHQQQQRAPSSNVWASNQSQNCGNMLSERPSTFVSQAPGGRSSFTIGDPDMCPGARSCTSCSTTNTLRRVDDRFSGHSHRSTLQSRENYPSYQEPSYMEQQQYDSSQCDSFAFLNLLIQHAPPSDMVFQSRASGARAATRGPATIVKTVATTSPTAPLQESSTHQVCTAVFCLHRPCSLLLSPCVLCRRAQCYGHVLRMVVPPRLLPALSIKILIFHSNCGRRLSAIQRWRARATARVQRGIHYNYARHLYHSLRPVNLPKQIPAVFVLFSVLLCIFVSMARKKRDTHHVCVCVCVCARARACVCVCVFASRSCTAPASGDGSKFTVGILV